MGADPCRQSAGNPTCRVAYVRAVKAQADAETHRIDIVFCY